jgi:tRNA splicing endonuclease
MEGDILEIQVSIDGMNGIVDVGSKNINFTNSEGTTIKVGEIMKTYDKKYLVSGLMMYIVHEIRKEAIYAALRKAGYKIL